MAHRALNAFPKILNPWLPEVYVCAVPCARVSHILFQSFLCSPYAPRTYQWPTRMDRSHSRAVATINTGGWGRRGMGSRGWFWNPKVLELVQGLECAAKSARRYTRQATQQLRISLQLFNNIFLTNKKLKNLIGLTYS